MSDSDSEGDYYGPALPPNLQQSKSVSIPDENSKSIPTDPETLKPKLLGSTSLPAIGPTLPPGFKLPAATDNDDNDNKHSSLATFPVHNESESDDDDVIGPLPPDHPLALARAASYQSTAKSDDDKPKKKLQREEWMLIPPTNKPVTELGLGPRKFLQRAPAAPVKDDGEPEDSDEEFERQTRAAMDQKIIDEYDKKMEAMIDKSDKGKRKSDSLLEIHQRELKKKSKNEASEETKRRPFDRNTDLAVTGLTKEDSKKYVEKSKELAGRFHKGRQKFL